MLKLHILAAPVLVFAFGLIAIDHVWKHFKCRVPAGRRSGLTAMWIFAPMAVSGYLIQAVTSPGALAALGWGHLVAGVVYLAGLLLHQRVFRGKGAARPPRGTRPPAITPPAVRSQDASAGQAGAPR